MLLLPRGQLDGSFAERGEEVRGGELGMCTLGGVSSAPRILGERLVHVL